MDFATEVPGQDVPDLAEERRDVLSRMVQTALTPGGRLVVIGDPGLGKSHLVDALVRSLPASRTVLFVRATGRGAEPFAGLAELLGGLPDQSHEGLPPAQRALLADLIGRSNRLPHDQGRLAAPVVGVLGWAASRGAAVVIDEWQWLDPDSLEILRLVLRRPELRDRLSVVAAGRRPTVQDADGGPDFFGPDQVVRLAPLRPSSIAGVLDEAGLGGLPPSTLAAVTEASGGNPLWAMALATARVTGDPRHSASSDDALHRQLDAVPAPVRRVLAVVALMGGARTDDLAQVCPDAGTATDEGLRRHLLRVDDGVWTVTEPMLARAAVQQLPAGTERELHLAIARLPLPLPRRAEHHDRALPPGVDEALARELLSAARRARRSGTPAVAVRLARRALARTADDSTAWTERAVEAAELALVTGDAGSAREFLRLLDPPQLSLSVFDRAACVLAESTERTGGATAVTRRFSELQRVLVPGSAVWDVAETHRLIAGPPTDHSGAETPELPGLSAADTPCTLAKALTGQARRRLDQGYGVDDELLARIQTLHVGRTVPLETTASALTAQWAYQADDLARSRTGLAASVHDAKLAGETYAVVGGLGHAATIEVLSGRLDLATTLLGEAEEHSLDLPTVPPSIYRARAVLALSRADDDSLDDLLSGPLDAAAVGRADLLRAEVVGLEAAAAGRWVEAADQLGHARALATARGVHEPARRLWIDVELGRSLVHLRRLPEAADVADSLSRIGARPGRTHARGQALRLRALVSWRSGDLAEALPLSALALADLHAGPYRSQLVRAQLERVSMLHAAGRPAQARGLLRSASTVARSIGDGRLQAEARHLYEELDETDSRAALTPAELRVARGVASGQTNRDIAADLFVSVRTVETHLASAYRKLGVHTRTQLTLSLNDQPPGVPRTGMAPLPPSTR